ncbi:MAG: glucose-6-phosphate isomerase family protein, partial [Chloroflexota bacterium]
MKPFLEPFSIALNPSIFSSFEMGKLLERKLSDLKDYYSDQNAVGEILSEDNPLIYKVWEMEYEGDGQGLSVGLTVINPGQIGGEFYMTKGHFHAADSGDEVYIATSGKGGMLLTDRSGNCQFIEMELGKLYYVPGNFAHRTVNIGSEEFVFLCVWPPNIIHDYETIAE